MIMKLALKNIKQQVSYYFVYFISMVFSVMIYYSFTSMSLNKLLVAQVGERTNLSAALQTASSLIVLFIVVFMFATNNFFLKKRKKEMGLYSLLGVRKYQMSLLLSTETLVIGLSALVVGIVAGIIFSKLFSMILIKAMYLASDSMFSFSIMAIKKTSQMFVAILLLISLRGAYVIYRYKLVELFQAHRVRDQVKKVTWRTWLLGVAGISLIGYGYYQAAHLMTYTKKFGGVSQMDSGLLLGLMLILFYCVLGTYLFFHSFLQLVMRGLQRSNRYYYRDIRMVTVGSIRFNLRQNSMTLATIAVLSGTAMSAIGGAANIYSFGMRSINSEMPVDYIVDSSDYATFEKIIAHTPKTKITSSSSLAIKVVGARLTRLTFEGEKPYTGGVNVISLRDYQALQKNNSYLNTLALGKGEKVALLESQLGESFTLTSYQVSQLILEGVSPSFTDVKVEKDRLGGARTARYQMPTMVVREDIYQGLRETTSYRLFYVNVTDGESNRTFYRAVDQALPVKKISIKADVVVNAGKVTSVIEDIADTPNLNSNEATETNNLQRKNIVARYPSLTSNRINFGLLVYIAIFLGVAFLIATGSIIMLKQLSQGTEEKERYQTLLKIGVTRAMIKKSVYRQNLVVFVMPLLVASCHAIFALKALNTIISSDSTVLTWVSVGSLLVVYWFFYLSTARSYNRIVNRD